MTLWDPFTRTPGGGFMDLAVPPALRVMGGVPATAAQLADAQTVFFKFLGMARLSAGPNPTAAGRLPDGSQYEISVVGNVKTMLLWPVGGEGTNKLRGIGISVRYSDSVIRMLVLTYQAGWKVIQLPRFYGGTGLWVSKSGSRYLTDDTLSQTVPNVSPRLFRPGVTEVEEAKVSTSVLKGLAYDNGNNGVALISQAGKYVQVKQEDLTAEIAECPLVSEGTFSQTPNDFVNTPVPIDDVVANPIPGRFLSGFNEAKGHLRHSRMRDGSAILFPLVDLDGPSGASITGNGWLTPFALTHVLRVGMATDGGYAAEAVPHMEIEFLLRVPDLPEQVLSKPWNRTRYDREIIVTTLPTPISAGGIIGWRDSGRSASTIIKLDGQHNAVEFHSVLERELDSRVPVFLSRGWSDEPITMTVRLIEEEVLTTDMEGRSIQDTGVVFFTQDGDGGPLTVPTAGWIPALGFDFVSISPDNPSPPESPGQYTLFGNVFLDATPSDPTSLYGTTVVADENIYIAKLETSLERHLETPWGNIQLQDRNTETTTRFTFLRGEWSANNPNLQTIKELLSVTGTDWFRMLHFIDPILGVIAYAELTTGGYEVTGPGEGDIYTVRTVNSTAKFVLWHKGEVVLEFALGAPVEGSILATGDELRAGRLVSSDGVVLTPSPITTTYEFPTLWVKDEDNVVPATVTTNFNSGQGTYTATNEFSQYFAKEITEGSVPRPVAPEGQYPVVATSAIDPNSGAGVVMLRESGVLKGAWAIDPRGGRRSLHDVITGGRGTPQEIYDLLISV